MKQHQQDAWDSAEIEEAVLHKKMLDLGFDASPEDHFVRRAMIAALYEYEMAFYHGDAKAVL